MREIVVAAVVAAFVSAVAVTALENGMFLGATAASSEGEPAGEPEEIIQGDADCDGDVDAVDALKDLEYVAALAVAQNDSCPAVGTAAAIQGPPGPPGISDYEGVSTLSDENSESPKSVTATCPEGKSIVGGGVKAFIGGGSIALLGIIESRPVGAEWKATVTEISGGTAADWSLEARAICVTVGD